MDDAKRLSKIANDTERFARQMAKDHAEADTLRERVSDLESALAKSASREAALAEKLKVAEAALVFINRATADGQAFDGFVISRAALAKIKSQA